MSTVPTITIRVTAAERAELDTLAGREGVTVSEYVRRTLAFGRERADHAAQLADHERRLAQLEALSGRS